MAKLPRKTAVLFAANQVASPSGFIAQFGSKAAGSPVFTSDPNVIQALARWLNGWTTAVTGTNQPNLQDVQALDYVLSYFICNMAERGVLDYDVNGAGTASSTVYNNGSIVNDGVGNLWVSLVDNNTALLTNTNNWMLFATFLKGPRICRAWLEYDGTNAVILDQQNIDHVTKISAGVYDVTFVTGTWGSSKYTFAGSCGTQDGVAPVGGDNNIVCGGVVGQGNGVRNATTCRVFCWDPNVSGAGVLEDTGCLSIQFFGN